MAGSGGTVRLTVTNAMGRFIRFVCITSKVQTALKVVKNNKRVTNVSLITLMKALSTFLGLPAQLSYDLAFAADKVSHEVNKHTVHVHTSGTFYSIQIREPSQSGFHDFHD